jgi:hypothetical protein
MAEGQSGAKEIARLIRGDSTRTARHADVINEIIDAVNALRNAKITRSGSGDGKFLTSDSNTVFDLGDVGGNVEVADDDGHDVANVSKITFVGYNATVVSDDGADQVTVRVFPDPPGGGTFVLASVGGDVDWKDTEECECGGGGGLDGGNSF